jgi:5-methylcytosine-specific restriction endonuclease McrA
MGAAMRICSGAGCGRAVPNEVRFCDECKAERPPEAKRLTSLERARTDPMQGEYIKPRWKTIRKLALQRHPFCKGWDGVPCNELSRVVDHNIPAILIVRVCRALKLFPYEQWPGFYILANLVGMCHGCHNKKTKTEDTEDWSAQLVTILITYLVTKEITESEAKAKVLKAMCL